MAPFRWPKVENDIALLKEIVARRPSKADEWEDIAEFLSSLFSTYQPASVYLTALVDVLYTWIGATLINKPR